jgi:hypothetical protein
MGVHSTRIAVVRRSSASHVCRSRDGIAGLPFVSVGYGDRVDDVVTPESSPTASAEPTLDANETVRVVVKRRGDGPPPISFRHGAHPPYAIRWFGSSALFGHLRHFLASAIASESVDTRDWMRAETAPKLLRAMSRILGGRETAPTLSEAVGRPLWIDFVADTGDDRDISKAVAQMIFTEYAFTGEIDAATSEPPVVLPRGDVLLFGGDTAYPVATADEIYRRLTLPWNEVLRDVGTGGKRRILLGIPGNHDWYDGLDGFARLFRRSVAPVQNDVAENLGRGRHARTLLGTGRAAGIVAKRLHLDEVGESLGLVADAVKSVRAFFKGEPLRRRKRLGLFGYEAVQESSYWSLPLAPNFDMWGADRQLRRVDFRQRVYFMRRRALNPDARILFCASDPALAFGERNKPGHNMLAACDLRLERDRVFYLAGDMHHYERCVVGRSQHVVAGGGGAFLHGTRINASRADTTSVCAYPTGAMSRNLVAQAPLKMMLGQAGFLPHLTFALLAMLEVGASLRSSFAEVVMATLIVIAFTVSFWMNAGHHRPHPRLVAAVAIPFGVVLGLGPMLLRLALPQVIPALAGDTAVIIVYAFLAAFGFGLFLTTCAILGIEHEQVFAALGHPGFKHFVRICIHTDGRVSGWVIGKDDPLAPGPPVVIDTFEWS